MSERRLRGNKHIKCQRGRYGDPDCEELADVSESVNWDTGNTTGTSFFYFCNKCWTKNKKGRKQWQNKLPSFGQKKTS